MNLVAGQYAIHRAVIGRFPFLPITDEQFKLLESAHRTAANATELEEKFDILIGNFFSLERELLEITLSQEIRHNFSHAEFQRIKRELNRKLLNLLSTCRLFQDSKKSHVEKILGADSEIVSQVAQKNSELYDGSFSFRFMEALRNYAQHRAFAIWKLGLGSN